MTPENVAQKINRQSPAERANMQSFVKCPPMLLERWLKDPVGTNDMPAAIYECLHDWAVGNVGFFFGKEGLQRVPCAEAKAAKLAGRPPAFAMPKVNYGTPGQNSVLGLSNIGPHKNHKGEIVNATPTVAKKQDHPPRTSGVQQLMTFGRSAANA